MDHGRPGGDGLIHSPAGGSPSQGVVEVRAAVADVADLFGDPRAVMRPSSWSRTAPADSRVFSPRSTPSATVCPVRWAFGTERV